MGEGKESVRTAKGQRVSRRDAARDYSYGGCGWWLPRSCLRYPCPPNPNTFAEGWCGGSVHLASRAGAGRVASYIDACAAHTAYNGAGS
eukprot:scaffold6334_cov137-Isochrysis_galbana.AAC.1